jgi:hypothetical protein
MSVSEYLEWFNEHISTRDFYSNSLTTGEREILERSRNDALELIELIDRALTKDEKARDKRSEANREKFMVTFGVNYEGSREAVYEIVFDTLLEAVQIAASLRGITAEGLTEEDTKGHRIEQVPAVALGALYEVIAGATVEVFTDESGTITEYDLY